MENGAALDGSRLTILGLPLAMEIGSGDDLTGIIAAGVRESAQTLRDFDVLVVAQKIVSKAEGRRASLADFAPSARALELARVCGKDPRLVEAVLSESSDVLRVAPNVLIVRHRLGFVMAQAGVDRSNVPGDDAILLLPLEPDGSAARLRAGLHASFGAAVGVVISDSFGRPWRLGTTNVALGSAGLAGALGPARREGPRRPDAGGHAGCVRGRDRECRRAGHGRRQRRRAVRAGARTALDGTRTAGERVAAAAARGSVSLTDIEIIALTGGIGGCKLALGLQHIVAAGRLACIVNTGDDFRHLGLHVSPDLDTALYTLAGLNDPVQGWGRRDETWTFMRVLEELGAPTWFRLGDGDLALHVERTRRLATGESLTAIMDDVRHRYGVPTPLLPMTDAPVRTIVETDAGALEFQDYFVRRRAEPRAARVRYDGADTAVTTACDRRGVRQPEPARDRDLPFESRAQHRSAAGGARAALAAACA